MAEAHHEFRGDELDGRTGAKEHSRSCVGPLDETTETGARLEWCTLRSVEALNGG